jgi:plastocyanin
MLPLRTLLAPMLIVLALALAACGDDDDSDTAATGGGDGVEAPATQPDESAPAPSDNAPAPSGDAVRAEKVEIVEFTYQPDPVTIEAGGKVIWTNRDSAPHTATADDGSFDTGTIETGKLKSESFKQAGSYPYFCEIHPEMRGTVEVVESG